MRGALRTVLVLSERPHPWALLRDRLDPDLVRVAWACPADAATSLVREAPWAVAGTGTRPLPDLTSFGGRLFGCRWVGPPPEGLPVRPTLLPDWQAVLSDLQGALTRSLRGLRLAPGSGLQLADGSFVSRAPELEALLGAHPAGIEVAGWPVGRVARRVAVAIERLGLPLTLRRSGRTLSLVELEATPDGGAA